MDAETLALFQQLQAKMSDQDKKDFQRLMDHEAEVNHPTVVATRRWEAAMKTAADEMSKAECLELMGALDEKMNTHGALSSAELSMLLRKLLAHMATA